MKAQGLKHAASSTSEVSNRRVIRLTELGYYFPAHNVLHQLDCDARFVQVRRESSHGEKKILFKHLPSASFLFRSLISFELLA